MSDIIARTMDRAAYIAKPTYEDYVATDREARIIATQYL
jgi:1-deoxy-D-xylulose-5-phosphate reductoisomerase